MVSSSILTVVSKRFFENYASFLPVLDSTTSPNSYYSESPFLFWTILVTGCRRYSEDPTMLGRIGPTITNMALLSLSSRPAKPIPVIQGLLLLCTWPVPVNTMNKDITYVLAGAAMHLAMQVGFHVFGIGQEFVRTTFRPGESEENSRARLWLHCLIVCQR